MFRIDGRVLAASVVGVFLVGAVIGFVVAGIGGGAPAAGTDQTPTPGDATPASTAVPTETGTAAGTDSRPGTATQTPVAATLVSTPTSTSTQTSTVVPPTETATRTPMLVRRFSVSEIKHHLRRMLNDWREERGLPTFKQADGKLVADLDRMARSHSVAMADAGQTLHEIDNRSSADRYRKYEVYWNCWLPADDGDYFVTPEDNSLEVLARTDAGVTYETVNGTDYNANESAVARDIFEAWTDNRVYRQRLAYYNGTRIGLGVETTRDNEVYATGNVCGPPVRSN